MGRVGIARTSWGELDRAEAAGPSWTELRRAKVSYGEPERAGATQLKKGRAGLTQSNREGGELGVMSGRLSLIHNPSVGSPFRATPDTPPQAVAMLIGRDLSSIR